MNQPVTLLTTMVATLHSGEPRPRQGSYAKSQRKFLEVHHRQESQASTGKASTRSSQTLPPRAREYNSLPKKTYPLLTSLLMSSSSSEEAFDNNGTGAHLSQERFWRHQKKNSGRIIDSNPGRSAPAQPSPHQQQLSTNMFLAVDRTHPPTDEQIKTFIANAVAHFRTSLQTKSTHGHTIAEVRDATLPSTSRERKVQKQPPNFAVVEQVTTSIGGALEDDGSIGSEAKAESTLWSEGGTASAPEKHSTGTLVSAVENSKHTLENESFKKSESVVWDLPIEQPLDVTMPARCDGKPVCSDDFCEDAAFVNSNGESIHSKRNVQSLLKDMPTIYYTLTALKELISALENRETVAEMDNVSKVILKQYWNGDKDNIHLFASTEYPQIMMEVATTCTKNEDQDPVVLTAVSGMKLEQLTEKYSSLIAGSSYVAFKDGHQAPVWSETPCPRPNKEKGGGGLTEVEAAVLDTEKTVAKELLVPHNGSVSVVFGSKATSANQDANKVKNTSSSLLVLTDPSKLVLEPVSPPVQPMYSHMLPEYEKAKDAPRPESICKEVTPTPPAIDPQYEDISDDEYSTQLDKKRPQAVHGLFRFQAFFENPKYEDISDDEDSQKVIVTAEKRSLSQELECSSKQCLLPVCVAQTGKHISDEWMIPETRLSLGTDDKLEDQMDDDDDYTIIPIIVSGLKYQPEDEDQDGPEEVRMQDGKGRGRTNQTPSNLDAPKPAAAPAFPILEVFETVQKFKEAKALLFFGAPDPEVASSRKRPDDGMDSEKEPCTPENRRKSDSDPEDSDETEDSSDYSPASEPNRLTVSRKYMLAMSAARPSKRDSSVSGKESRRKVPKVRKFQPETFKQRSPKKEDKDVFIIDSDTEDELVQNGEAVDCQPRRLSSEYVKETTVRKPLPANLPGPRCPSEAQGSQVLDLRDSADSGLSGHVSGEKAVQHETRKPTISKKKRIIILDLYSDEDGEISYRKPKRKKLFRSGDALSDQLEKYSLGNEKPEDAMLPSAGPSVPRQPSKGHDSSCKIMTENACLKQSRIIPKTGKPIEGKAGLEHGQHKAVKQSSHKRSKKKFRRVMSSGSEDSGDGVLAAQKRARGTASVKPQTSRLPPERRPQPHKDVDSALVPNPVIPRFIIESTPNNEPLKLSSTSTTQNVGKDKAQVPKSSTAVGRNTTALDKNEKGRLKSREQPAHKGHHRTTKEGQAESTKPSLISKHSLPSPEVPFTSNRSGSSTSDARQTSSQSSSQPGAVPPAPVKCPPRGQPSASKLQRSHSSSSTLMGSSPSPSSSATKQSSAKMQVRKDWGDNYYPINRHRRTSVGTEEDFRNAKGERVSRHPGPSPGERVSRQPGPSPAGRVSRQPGPHPGERVSRQRHGAFECHAPLMKKTINDFKQLKKANTCRDQRK